MNKIYFIVQGCYVIFGRIGGLTIQLHRHKGQCTLALDMIEEQHATHTHWVQHDMHRMMARISLQTQHSPRSLSLSIGVDKSSVLFWCALVGIIAPLLS